MLSLASPAVAVQVTLRLVDQLAVPVPGSQFVIAGQAVLQNGTISLSPGAQNLTVIPAINGVSSQASLARVEPVTIGANDTTIVMTWHYADLDVVLVDQLATVDDSVTFTVPGSAPTASDRVGPATYRLPVTEEQGGEATYAGLMAAGYTVWVSPSLNGVRQGGVLTRLEPAAELGTDGLLRTFVWRRENLTVRVVDQLSVQDDSATFTVPYASYGKDGVGAPSYRLPVTVEQPGDPPYLSTFAAGYTVAIYPSINDTRQGGLLLRVESAAELDAGGMTRTFVWRREDLTVRVVDQLDVQDDSATVTVPYGTGGKDGVGAPTYRLPVTVEQPGDPPYQSTYAAGYTAAVYPSINDTRQGGLLLRVEAAAELGAGGLSRSFVWRRENLTVRLVDQFATQDDSASFSVPHGVTGRDGVGTPTYRMPVTVEQPGDPPYQSTYASGYSVGVYPSINEQRQGGLLYRTEAGVEVNLGGLTRSFAWSRADLTVRLLDQLGTEDDSAMFTVPASSTVATDHVGPVPYRLPVTVELPGEPAYQSTLAAGYDVSVYPSIHGVRQGNLLKRTETKVELDAQGATRFIEWRRLSGPILVGDSTGFEFPDAAFEIGPLGAKPAGSFVSIPVTEDSTQSPISLAYSGGYPTFIRPALEVPFSGPFTLELRRDLTFSPQQVTIGGARAGLFSDTGPPLTESVLPEQGGNGGAGAVVTLTVVGRNLRTGCEVRLIRAGHPVIEGESVQALGLSAQATFDLEDAAPGAWDVEVTNPDAQAATLPGAFTIVAVEAPQLRVVVLGPSQVRSNYPASYDIVVENAGNVDAVAVPLWLAGLPASAIVEPVFAIAAVPSGSGEPDWSGVPLTLPGTAGQYLSLLLPRVPPGVTVRRVNVTVPGSVGSYELSAGVTPGWAEDVPALVACLTSQGVSLTQPCVGGELAGLEAYLVAHPELAAVNGVGAWAREAWRCEGVISLPAAVAKAEQVLDVLVTGVEQPAPLPGPCQEPARPRWRTTLLVTVVGAVDPNDKLGPTGLVSLGQQLPYTIRFENTGNAPAQRVTVADTLDTSVFDVSKLSLGEIRFGDFYVAPPPGLSRYATELDLRPERNLIVRVGAELDPVTGILVWQLRSVDPATGLLLPPHVLDGFLPPSSVSPHTQGQGSVFFTVEPQAGLSPGATVTNRASLKFDNELALPASWENVLDNVAPASHVMPLAATQDSVNFTVRWEASGSPTDLRDFTVYFSQDGGEFRPWRLSTTATSAQFATQPGRTYAFYSVARDLSGNIEDAPNLADANTLALADVIDGPGLGLRLEGARPNPAKGVIHAWFTLPAEGNAKLELIDVTGRRVAQRDVGALGPGSHTVTMGRDLRLAAGLYWLRLTRAGERRNARVVMIR
jgi:uncharacterized repeat protein (TIGR01451 family)